MPDTDPKLVAYQEAVKQLQLHAPLIWTRSNFFLLIQGGMMALVLKDEFRHGGFESGIVVSGGALLALLWTLVTFAGQRIQREWRRVVVDLEAEYFGKDQGPFARALPKTKEGKSSANSITEAILGVSILCIVTWAAAACIIWWPQISVILSDFRAWVECS